MLKLLPKYPMLGPACRLQVLAGRFADGISCELKRWVYPDALAQGLNTESPTGIGGVRALSQYGMLICNSFGLVPTKERDATSGISLRSDEVEYFRLGCLPFLAALHEADFSYEKHRTEVRQLERCFEVTSSVRSRVFNGFDGAGVLIFTVFVITILRYFI